MTDQVRISELLKVAEWRMAYCETIISHVAAKAKRNFDPDSPIDSFYKNVCVMSFNDAVLILGSLLDMKSPDVISFQNWGLTTTNAIKLKLLKDSFDSGGLKGIRDQIIAHHDKKRPENNFPSARIKGYIDPVYVERVQKILIETIMLFLSQMKEIGQPFDPKYFDNIEAKTQITKMLELAQPKLTKDIIG